MESAENLSESHALEDAWTLWFQKQKDSGTVNAKSWLEGLTEVMTFSTVEEFWRMYNNIKTPTEMPAGTDYCVFKEGIAPKWEAPEHTSGGGVWRASYQQGSLEAEVLNKIWLFALLACIGADFGHEEYEAITGLYLSLRRGRVKVELWCRSTDEEKTKRIGSRFEDILQELHKTTKSPLSFESFQTLNVGTHKTYTPKGTGGGNRVRDGNREGNFHGNHSRDNLKSSGGY